MDSVREPNAFRKLEMEKKAEEYFQKFDPTVMLSDDEVPVEKESKSKMFLADNSSTCVTMSRETPSKNIAEDYTERVANSSFRKAPKVPSRVKTHMHVSTYDHRDLLSLDCAEEPTWV